MNFTPAYVHQLHNKTLVFQELKTLKQAARDRRKAYWLNPETLRQDPVEGGYPNYGPRGDRSIQGKYGRRFRGGRSHNAPCPS